MVAGWSRGRRTGAGCTKTTQSNVKGEREGFWLITRFLGFWPRAAITGQVLLDCLGGSSPVSSYLRPPQFPPG
jgi:hypothetical protein